MWAPHHLAIQSLSGLAEPGHAAVALILGGAVGPLRAVPTQKLVAVAPVSHGTALLQIQVSGVPRLPEAVPDGTGHLLRPAGQSHARQATVAPSGIRSAASWAVRNVAILLPPFVKKFYEYIQ